MASPSTIRRNITDRALRYRANANAPTGPKICALCGSKTNVEVGHVDGHEENTKPSNLFWTCRSCNVKAANAMRKAGLGRLTKQYNPAAVGAETLGQWMNAVMSMKSDGGTMSVADGVAMIRATSPEDRSRYAREIWGKRHQRGTASVKRHNRRTKLTPQKAAKKRFLKARAVKAAAAKKKGKRKNGLWDRIKKIGSKSTVYSVPKQSAKMTLSTRFKGQEIFKTKEGDYRVPGIEKESSFDSLGDAKQFVTRWANNPHNQLYTVVYGLNVNQVQKFEGPDSKDRAFEFAHGKADQTGWSAFVHKGPHMGFGATKGKKVQPAGRRQNAPKLKRLPKKQLDRYYKAAEKGDTKTMERIRRSAARGFSVVQGKASAVVKPEAKAWVVYMKGEKPKPFQSVEAAAKYARLRVHETAPANNPRSRAARKLRRSNPQEDAERMYHVFHGKPAAQVIEFVQQEHVHEWLWAAGTLVSIEVANNSKSMLLKAADPEDGDEEDVVMVAFSEDGRQAYFVGGDQDIDLDRLMDEFGLTEDDVRDHMKIGVVRKLTYRTSKNFEEKGKVDIDFYHKLGGEHSKGVMPDLVFKPLNPSMELVGGRYFVAPKDGQLGASPGVVG
jgi:hypothetical protein